MPLLTLIGLIPTGLSIINGIIQIFHNPSVATQIQAITTGAVAIASSFAIHGAVTAHAKSDDNKKKLNDATKPGH
jgi:hypothetical protein